MRNKENTIILKQGEFVKIVAEDNSESEIIIIGNDKGLSIIPA